MTPNEFCYWLQGFMELDNRDVNQLSAKQVNIIKDHLKLIFTKVTPAYAPSPLLWDQGGIAQGPASPKDRVFC